MQYVLAQSGTAKYDSGVSRGGKILRNAGLQQQQRKCATQSAHRSFIIIIITITDLHQEMGH